MTYVEIWRERIATGNATIFEAYNWLVDHGMNELKAWDALHARV